MFQIAFIFQAIVILVVTKYILADTPVYSEKYAKVLIQPRKNKDSHKAELNLEIRHKEEVTEKSTSTNQILSEFEKGSFETTTDPESEQIHPARFVYRNIVKDKLIDDSNKPQNVNNETENTTQDNDKETKSGCIIFEGATWCDDNTVKEKENIETQIDESIETFDESEISDLNHQGVYYIYHPQMLLQKVVYRTQIIPENVDTQENYENVEPIIEHIYTYDPRTFVLQRLLLKPQEPT